MLFHRKCGGPPTLEELREIERTGKEELQVEEDILQVLRKIEHNTNPRLSSIKVAFKKGLHMSNPVAGPITLVAVGQQVTASVLGFDQFGQPFTGPIPTPTFSSDDTSGAIVTFDPSTGLVTDVANGVANITASLTTAEGLVLTDTEAVTVANPIAPPPTPVLSSIKVAFV